MWLSLVFRLVGGPERYREYGGEEDQGREMTWGRRRGGLISYAMELWHFVYKRVLSASFETATE